MVVADDEGNLFEHPELEMVGAQGTEPVAPEPEELSPLPGGSKFFTIPDSIPVGGDPEEDALISVEEADWGDGAAALQAACTFPSPGWMRTLLPFAERDPGAQVLPLWAYTALGFDEESGEFVCAAVQVDDCPRWEPEEYDDTGLPGRIEQMREAHPKNRMIPHLARCARSSTVLRRKTSSPAAGRWACPSLRCATRIAGGASRSRPTTCFRRATSASRSSPRLRNFARSPLPTSKGRRWPSRASARDARESRCSRRESSSAPAASSASAQGAAPCT